MNLLLKKLNIEIIEWENLYGEWYTFLYNPDGSQVKEEINNDFAYKCLKECLLVMNVLKSLKNNRFKNRKRTPKRKYKISK